MLQDRQRQSFEGNALNGNGAIVPYDPAQIAQVAFDALPPARQNRNNLNMLMQCAEKPDVLEAVILEDKDLSKNPQIVNLFVQQHHHYHYPAQQIQQFQPPVSSSSGGIVPPSTSSIFTPHQAYSPRNSFAPVFSPRIEVRPIIHVNTSAHAESTSESSQDNSGEGSRLWLCCIIVLVFFLGIGVQQNQ